YGGTSTQFTTKNHEQWSPEVLSHPNEIWELCAGSPCGTANPSRGLLVAGSSGSEGTTVPGDRGDWIYTVPRWFSDPTTYEGKEPTSFISKMTLSHISWTADSNAPSPYAVLGLWSNSTNAWTSDWVHTGQKEHSVYEPAWAPEFPGYGTAVAGYVMILAN